MHGRRNVDVRRARCPTCVSLAYLAVFGSVVAFGAYLTLLKQVGAGPSSYVGVATPVIAMLLSTLFEGYQLERARRSSASCSPAVGNVLVLSAPADPLERVLFELSFASAISFFQLREIGLRSARPSRSGGPGMISAPSLLEALAHVGLRENPLRLRVEPQRRSRAACRRRDDAPVVDHVGVGHALLLPARHVRQERARRVPVTASTCTLFCAR